MAELEGSPEKVQKEEESDNMRNMMRKTDEKYHRPVTSSVEKRKEESRKKGMDYAQYKEKYGVGKRPQSGIGKNWFYFSYRLSSIILLSIHYS